MADTTIDVAGGPERLSTGTYLVDTPCPRCGVVEEILVAITSVHTLPMDAPGSLRVKLKGKARDHDCAQMRVVS